jgi:mannosyltransferase
MIVHTHFHSHKTGVTKSVENVIPVLNKFSDALVFGYGIKAPKISLGSLLRLIYSNNKPVIHAHRNNEIIFALLLRSLGGKFKLVFTRHAESKPSGFTVWLLKKADNLVSLSSSMARNLPCQSTIIKHGVNTEIFRIQEKVKIEGIPQENLISVIGRIRPAKGQLVVLKALISPLKNNPDWGLMLIGKIDEKEYAEEIYSIASENGISAQVHFMPESDEIINYYQASSVVVIASVSEGFSLVCLEAMSCGLITIATESVGIHSEVIKHGENGFLFPKNDHESLSRIITDIVSKKISLDPEKIRQTIVDNWSIERSVKELIKLYGIIPHPPTPSPRIIDLTP